MDYLLPDDNTMAIMAKEFSKLKLDSTNVVNQLNATGLNKEITSFISSKVNATPLLLLVLYFVFSLGYNLGYGTHFYDSNRGVAGFQSCERPVGNSDYFFGRK